MLNNNINEINEKVQLVVDFSPRKITPLLLLWRGQKIKIVKQNLCFQKQNGAKSYYYFFVSDQNDNCYKLCFDTDKLIWVLVEVTYE